MEEELLPATVLPPATDVSTKGEGDAEPKKCGDASIKWAALAVFFVGIVANSVTAKKLSIASSPYPYAQTQTLAFVGCVVYFPVVAVGVVGGCIRRHQLVMTWWHPVLIGMLFCLHNIFANIGNMGNTVPGELALLLSKFTVVFSMALGELPCFRGVHVYNTLHLTALLVLVAGFIVGVLGELSLSVEDVGLFIADVVCLVGATLPLAFAFVFMEKQLRQTSPQLHPTWLWAIVCTVEMAVGFPLIYLNGAVQRLPMDCVWWNFWEGLACLAAGIDLSAVASSVISVEGKNISSLVAQAPSNTAWHEMCDNATFSGQNNTVITVDCPAAMWWFYWNFVPGLAFNFAMPVATRYGGATMLWFTRAMALPFAAVFFSLSFIMGPDTTPVTVGEIVSIVIVTAALLIYELAERVGKIIQGLLDNSPRDRLAPRRCRRCSCSVFILIGRALRGCCKPRKSAKHNAR